MDPKQIRLARPTTQTVNFLYDGLVNLWPSLLFKPEELPQHPQIQHWEGLTQQDFMAFVRAFVNEDPSIAASIILDWRKQAEDGQSVPQQMDQLVKDFEEAQKQKQDQQHTRQEFVDKVKKVQEQKIYLRPKQPVAPPAPLSPQANEVIENFKNAVQENPQTFIAEVNRRFTEDHIKIANNQPLSEITITNIQTVTHDLTTRLHILNTDPGKLTNILTPESLLAVADFREVGVKVAEAAQTKALAMEHDLNIVDAIIKTSFGEETGQEIIDYLYRPAAQEFEIVKINKPEDKQEDDIEIDPQELVTELAEFKKTEVYQELSSPQTIQNIQQGRMSPTARLYQARTNQSVFQNLQATTPDPVRIANSIQYVNTGFQNITSTGQVISRSASTISSTLSTRGLLLVTPVSQYLATTAGLSLASRPLLTPVWNASLGRGMSVTVAKAVANGRTASFIGFQVGTTTKLAAMISGPQIVFKTATKTAVLTVGTRAIGTLAGAARIVTVLSNAIPFFGQITAFVGSIILPALAKFIYKHKGKLTALLGSGLLALGLGTSNAFAGILGAGVLFAGAVASAGSIAGGVSLAASTFVAGTTALTSAFLAAIAIPLVVTLITLMIAIPLILFIINSGAYIVPPGSLNGAQLGNNLLVNIESEYMRVTKTADKPGPYKNPDADAGITITYSVKIEAKKGNLENLRVTNKCTVAKKNAGSSSDILRGNNPNCNPPVPGAGDLPGSISSVSPYIFTYTMTYKGAEFYDSFVVDSFEVHADIPGVKTDDLAIGSAGIRIGDPPSECPSSWPVALDRGQTYRITQTAGGADSHNVSIENPDYRWAEALDIAPDRYDPRVNLVFATHNGTVRTYSNGASGPNGVRIAGSCNGLPFASLYAHMATRFVTDGQVIIAGQVIGVIGTLGNSSGPHLHYEFQDIKNGIFYQKGAFAKQPTMISPFIPKTFARQCVGLCGRIP